MIVCAFYTPERKQTGNTVLRPPLSLKLQREGNGVLATPLVTKTHVILEGGGRTLECFENNSLNTLWKTLPGLWSTVPVACGNHLFMDYFETEEAVSVDMNTGIQIRKEAPIGNLDQFTLNENIYFITYIRRERSRKVICKNCETYTTIWEYDIDNDFYPDRFTGSNGYIVVKNDDAELFCLDIETGNKRWEVAAIDTGLFSGQQEIDAIQNDQFDNGMYNLKRTTGYASISDDVVVTPMFNNFIIGLNIMTGKLLWSVRSEKTHNFTRQAYGHEMYAMGNGYIEAWDMRSGEQTRSIKVDPGEFQDSVRPGAWCFTVSETHIFAIIPNVFYAINKETGKVEWAYEPGKEIRENDQPYIANGRIYFRTMDGLYVFEGADGFIPPG